MIAVNQSKVLAWYCSSKAEMQMIVGAFETPDWKNTLREATTLCQLGGPCWNIVPRLSSGSSPPLSPMTALQVENYPTKKF
jgi:hypothetical protein